MGITDNSHLVKPLYTHEFGHEHWAGKSGDQSGTDWASESGGVYTCISGLGVYGADANDEAKVFGASDTPVNSNMTKYEIHRILTISSTSDTVWKIRIVWGTGTLAAAITAQQYTETMFIIDSINPQTSGGAPVEITMPLINVGTNIWIQGRNATDNAQLTFYVGWREY